MYFVFLSYPPGGLDDSQILSGDTSKISQLTSWLEPRLQNSSKSYWALCWRASTHGWGAGTFHSNCDGRGPTVTIVSVGSYIFGGYTDQSWQGMNYFCLQDYLFSKGLAQPKSKVFGAKSVIGFQFTWMLRFRIVCASVARCAPLSLRTSCTTVGSGLICL